ncbi:MAG: sensor histidine kinase [Longibaculum sp.]
MKEYIYDVAHDLKAPAASLYGYVELLNSGIAKKQNKEDYFLKQIAKKVEILSERIALLQKLDIERISLNKEEVSIQSLIESLKDKYQILLKKKELSIQIKGDDFIINVDREKIIICLENLLLNAIEHAYVHTNIFFELGEDDWGYQVSISNLGKMVSQEEINHFFERGYTTGGENHSGLGLSICQKIMNAHMGTISVKNKKETITFIMRFIKK